jgi:uncharacterized protein GlcG (DUF336 family)
MHNLFSKFIAGIAAVGIFSGVYALALQLIKSATLQSLTEYNISVDQALLVAQGALDACKKDNNVISVAVVDHNGGVRFLLRGDGATPEGADNARKKAYSARTFRMTTTDWIERTSPEAVDEKGVKRDLTGQRFLENTLAEPGGVPIMWHGDAIGGVGVSGAKDGASDEACAKAGVAAIADQLL